MSLGRFSLITKNGSCDGSETKNCVIALGFFDGVHIAHRRLIGEAVSLSKKLGAEKVGVWCFSSSPASVLGEKNIPLLSSPEDKIKKLLSLGIDFVAVGDFAAYRDIAAEAFISDILVKDLGCIGTVCGFNHHFGKNGLGNADMLAKHFGSQAVTVPEVRIFSETVSSTAIRAHILEGNISLATEMLGEPYSLTAPVVKGKALGRKLGFPTANQFFPKDVLAPRRGIYATLCVTENGERYIGVSNVGTRPTIVDGSDSHIHNCETYLHGFSGDLYGEMLKVEFREYLREEKKFDSLDSLRAQIERDLQASVAYFKDKNF